MRIRDKRIEVQCQQRHSEAASMICGYLTADFTASLILSLILSFFRYAKISAFHTVKNLIIQGAPFYEPRCRLIYKSRTAVLIAKSSCVFLSWENLILQAEQDGNTQRLLNIGIKCGLPLRLT